MFQSPLWRKHNTEGSRKRERVSYGSGREGGAHRRAEPLDFPPVRPPSLNLPGFFFGGVAKLGHLPSKRKGGRFALIHQKMLKIFIINPTYQYVYECIVKIVYHSYEDGNKKFNHQLLKEWRVRVINCFSGLKER